MAFDFKQEHAQSNVSFAKASWRNAKLWGSPVKPAHLVLAWQAPAFPATGASCGSLAPGWSRGLDKQSQGSRSAPIPHSTLPPHPRPTLARIPIRKRVRIYTHADACAQGTGFRLSNQLSARLTDFQFGKRTEDATPLGGGAPLWYCLHVHRTVLRHSAYLGWNSHVDYERSFEIPVSRAKRIEPP